jgi:TRAP-type C4-dicarboxylate transport system permease large subunit
LIGTSEGRPWPVRRIFQVRKHLAIRYMPVIPYLVVLLIGLFIVAFVPWFTVFLPNAFGLGG